MGYTDPDLTAAAFDADGWFHTGDVGVLDADGYLRITDRLTDVIIRGGENISAVEVEDLLSPDCRGCSRWRWSPPPTSGWGSGPARSSGSPPAARSPTSTGFDQCWPRPGWPARSGRRSCG